MEDFVKYYKLLSIYGLTQTGLILGLSGYGVSWSAHKILNSIITTQQLQSYNGYHPIAKIAIGLMNAATETTVFLFSFICLLKGFNTFIFTPLSLYPLMFGNNNNE